MNLLLFGGGGIAIYILDKKESKNIGQEDTLTIAAKRTKMIALAFGCLCFVVASYWVLPFNHFFDNTRNYTPIFGYIVGIIGILFFGSGLIVSIIAIVKRSIVLQISNDGILVSKGVFKQIFIVWKDIDTVAINGECLCLYLTNYDVYPMSKTANFLNKKLTGTNINIPVQYIDYEINQVVNLITNKLIKYNDHVPLRTEGME